MKSKTEKKKVKVMENKLALLGLLGIEGFLGLGTGIPYLAAFLAFLPFFAFAGVKADEMFRQQVQKAGLRALYVYLAASIISIEFLLLRAAKNNALWLGDLQVFVETQKEYLLGAFSWIFALTVCVFVFTLLYYAYREKKALDEPMFANLRDIVAENPVWGAITVWFLFSVIASLVSSVISVSFVSVKSMDGGLYMLLAYTLITAAALFVAMELFGSARLGLKRGGLKRGLLWGLPVLLAVYILSCPPSEPLLFSSLAEFMPLLPSLLLCLVAVYVMLFYNEVLCRGLILNILMGHWGHSRGGVWRALTVSSLLVCLLALPSLLFSGLPSLTVMSGLLFMFSMTLFLGALYLRSGNLWVTTIARCCATTWTVVVSFLTVEGFSFAAVGALPTDMGTGEIIRQVLCATLMLISAFLLARRIELRPPIIEQMPEVKGLAENPA